MTISETLCGEGSTSTSCVTGVAQVEQCADLAAIMGFGEGLASQLTELFEGWGLQSSNPSEATLWCGNAVQPRRQLSLSELFLGFPIEDETERQDFYASQSTFTLQLNETDVLFTVICAEDMQCASENPNSVGDDDLEEDFVAKNLTSIIIAIVVASVRGMALACIRFVWGRHSLAAICCLPPARPPACLPLLSCALSLSLSLCV